MNYKIHRDATPIVVGDAVMNLPTTLLDSSRSTDKPHEPPFDIVGPLEGGRWLLKPNTPKEKTND